MIVYDADSLTSPINQLLSIDLTIAGHSYSLADAGFIPFGADALIGGLFVGVGAIASRVNDFGFRFNLQTGLPNDFTYGTPSTTLTSTSTISFTRSLVNEPVVVAEPSALALFAVGLLGLTVGGHRRRTFR